MVRGMAPMSRIVGGKSKRGNNRKKGGRVTPSSRTAR